MVSQAENVKYCHISGFSLDRLEMGDLSPPIWGGQVQGDKALMGAETPEGDINLIVAVMLLILL